MPVELKHMRELLLPGLRELQYSFDATKEIWAANVMADPIINPVVALSAKEVAVLGAAAILAKNPIVSRRFWDAGD